MAASRRVSPAAARPSGTPGAPRARGRRRRPSLWRRALLAVPRPALRRRPDRIADLEAEVLGLRLAIGVLQAQVRELAASAAAATAPPAEEPSVTLLLPLARAAMEAGAPTDADVPVDLAADTTPTQIDLRDLPEAPLLDPRVQREAELEQLLAEVVAGGQVAEPQRESA